MATIEEIRKEAQRRGLVGGQAAPPEGQARRVAPEGQAAQAGPGFFQRTGNWLMGHGRSAEFDYPELPDLKIKGDVLTTGARMGVARSDFGKFDVLRTQLGEDMPGAKLDSFGNLYVDLSPELAARIQGKIAWPENMGPAPTLKPGKYYLNKPGLSGQDIAETVGTILPAAIGGGVGASAGKAVAAGLGRVAGAAIGSGIGSIAQDLGAQAEGSRDPVSLKAAGQVAALAGAGEFAIPIIGKFLGGFVRNRRYFANGALTPAGEDVFRRLGVDPSDVSPELAASFGKMAATAESPEQAAILAQSRALPGGPVPLTRGDLSRNVRQQRFEDAALKGIEGEAARTVAVGAQQAKNEALFRNAAAVQGRIGGNVQPQITAPAEGMLQAQQGLAAKAAAAKQAIGDAYITARGGEAYLDSRYVQGLADHITTGVRRDFTPGTVDAAEKVMADLRGLGDTTAQGTGSASIRQLEEWRQRASRTYRGLADTDPSKAAIKQMLDGYDAMTKVALRRSLYQGDVAAVEAWKKAAGLRADFAKRFQSNEIMGDLIERGPGGKGLKVSPDDALNYLWTVNGVGKKGAGQALYAMKQELGADSAPWLALKEAQFMRLLRSQGEGNKLGGDMRPLFSGDKFMTAFRKAMTDSPEMMRSLYTPEDFALVKQFAEIAQRATNRVEGAVNTSGSAYALNDIVNRMIGSGLLGRLGIATVRKLTGWAVEGSKAVRMQNALRDPLAIRAAPGAGRAGAAAGPTGPLAYRLLFGDPSQSQ
jgi:hypothetical protein